MSERAEKIGLLAKDSLVFEARLSPKPGLVDAENSGSHADMDLALLLKSADVLEPFFARFALAGEREAALDPVGRLFAIRPEGIAAEQAMLAATGGVNTHKGAIFLLGLLCCAAGRLAERSEPLSPARVACTAALVCRGVTKELGEHAGRAYARHGAGGARAEAEAGFPDVLRAALPTYEKAIFLGAEQTDAWLLALLKLIGRVKDTNVLDRGGEPVAHELKRRARAILRAYPSGGADMRDEIRLLDEFCRARRVSPGGSADLLACAKFLRLLARPETNEENA